MAESRAPTIEFMVKPRLCVLSEHETQCEDELEIRWKAQQPHSLCLFRSDKRLPLRCWENELSGNHSLLLSTAHNVGFHLKQIEADLLLVSQEYEVVQDNPQFRRRRRNPWSFF